MTSTASFKHGICTITPPQSGRGSHRIRWSEPGKGQQERSTVSLGRAMEIANGITSRVQEETLGTVVQVREAMKVSALAKRYLASLPDGPYRDRQEGVLRLWILPKIGHLGIVGHWSPANSKAVLDNMRGQGKSRAYIQSAGQAMRALVSFAQANYWLTLGEDPMFKVVYQQKGVHQGEHDLYIPRSTVPSIEQVQSMRDAGYSLDQPIFALMWELKGYCGARWSEMIALQKRDFDLDHRKVFINKTIRERSGRMEFTNSTKNNKHRHSIFAASMADRLVERLDAIKPSDLVFVGPQGGALRRSNHLRWWQPAAEKAGWPMESRPRAAEGMKPVWSPHDLRHAAACWMLFDLKAEPSDAAFWLGHHSPAFTMSRYVGRRGDIDQHGLNLTESW